MHLLIIILTLLVGVATGWSIGGSNVYVEGSFKAEKREDQDGNKKQITKVVGSKLIMLGLPPRFIPGTMLLSAGNTYLFTIDCS